MVRQLLSICICLLITTAPAVVAAATTISYEEYLKLRDSSEVTVIDAYEIEPLLHVGSKATPEENGLSPLTQGELDQAITAMIPTKDTTVILYCWQNFAQTRTMPARVLVGLTLERMGYINIYMMDDIWPKHGDTFAKAIFKKDIEPYKTPLPKVAIDALKKVRVKNSDEKNAEKSGDIE